MTPPINSVSPERLDELARWAASEEAECLQDDMPVSAGYYADIIKLIAARRAANTPVDPEALGYDQISQLSPALPSQVVGAALTAYELQVLLGTSISGCNMEADRTFDLPATWARLKALGLIDRADGLAIATDKGLARIQACLTSPAAEAVASVEVEWVVNEIAELGVKIGDQFFFCYKGRSLTYTGDNGSDVVLMEGTNEPMHWRPVFKREFGECIHPINYADLTKIGTVSLSDSDEWKPLPAAKEIDSPFQYPAPSASREVTERIRAILDHPSGSPKHDLGAIRAALLAALPGTGDELVADLEHFFDPRDEHEPADIRALALRMAVERGGQTCPVSSYDITNAREQITGEVKEADRLRRELRAAEASLASAREDAIDDTAAAQWLRTWVKRKFGVWITWRTAWSAIKEMRAQPTALNKDVR